MQLNAFNNRYIYMYINLKTVGYRNIPEKFVKASIHSAQFDVKEAEVVLHSLMKLLHGRP